MSLLNAEIDEQPEALRRLLDGQVDRVRELAAAVEAARVGWVLLAARGSSDNAARYGQYLFGVDNRLPVALATPSLYTHYSAPPRLGDALVVGVSQSGRSPDIVAVLTDARRQGRPTVAVTNDPDSPLARAAEWVVELQAGQERSIAATKTYLNSLGALALLSACLRGDEDRLAGLRALPDAIRATIDSTRKLIDAGAVDRFAMMGHCLVVGRGFNYATAHEIALKIKELTGVIAEPFSSADVRHGPIGAVGRGFPVLLVAPGGAVLDDLRSLHTALRERGAIVAAVSDDPELLAGADVALGLPAPVDEWWSPLTAIVPGQLLAARLATLRGVDVDSPGGLQKVTETT